MSLAAGNISIATTFQPLLFDDDASARSTHAGISVAPFDDSETDDIVLVRPLAVANANRVGTSTARADARPPQHADPAFGGIAIDKPARRPPMRIGHGKLAATRLGWRPGDPFDQSARTTTGGFEWNRMFRSACFTAACGLIAVWLLHTIFA